MRNPRQSHQAPPFNFNQHRQYIFSIEKTLAYGGMHPLDRQAFEKKLSDAKELLAHHEAHSVETPLEAQGHE